MQSVTKNLWGAAKFSDVILDVQGNCYCCHRALLSATSPLLNSIIQENKDAKKISISVERFVISHLIS